MNTFRLFVMVFVGIFTKISCYSAGKADSDDFETKMKLLSLLSPPFTARAIEYPSAEFEKNNYIYSPSYKSKYNSGHHYSEESNHESPEEAPAAKNEAFRFPSWPEENKMRQITAEQKTPKYEVVEANDESDVRFSFHPSQKFAGYLPGYGPKYGFYQGLGPHFHHSHDFHNSREFHHEHTPDCHNRGRPRPPPPPPSPAPTQSTSTTTASPSVDPRASTMAGIISTEIPSIDIRFARHIQNGADRIVFED